MLTALRQGYWIQPTVFRVAWEVELWSILVMFSAWGLPSSLRERQARRLLQSQSGRRRRAVALASVRRSNFTCRFPAYSFHEDARERE
jgi:hypothetical protein